jgi:predicted nucleotidyltransferase
MRECLAGGALHAAIAEVLGRHLDPRSHQAWIIGSEATHRALPGSDVDIAIEGDGPIDLECLARLRADLEDLPTLRGFDLVDLRRATARFREEALREAIRLLPVCEERRRVQG